MVTIIFIDEAFSLHAKLPEEAERALKSNKTVVFVYVGDSCQILPVIEHGTPQDIIGATLTSSPIWLKTEVFFLTENKRLTQLSGSITSESSPEDRNFAKGQADYARMILQIGDSSSKADNETIFSMMESTTGPSVTNIFGLTSVQYFLASDSLAALDWLHPKVGDTIPSMRNDTALKNRAILAIKNSRVDFWNTTMQDMNPNDSVQLKSFDYFTDVDDPNGHLASMLTEHVLNEYTNSQVPNHIITLKIDDICFIMRPLKASGLASNTRVRIHDIKQKVITVKVLDSDNPNHLVFVPRMRFNCCLKYTSSYNMTRVQFPLKLCYGMTVDKSQGQSFEDVLLDFTDESFSHGQTYVGFSRARNYKNVRIIVQDDKVMELPYRTEAGDISFKKAPLVSCTTYPSVIQKPL
jgi:hypothetical protein